MVSQFAIENERLAAASEAAASRRALVDSDYKSAMAPLMLVSSLYIWIDRLNCFIKCTFDGPVAWLGRICALGLPDPCSQESHDRS